MFACGGGGPKARGPGDPISAAASRIEVVTEPKPTCKKLGSVHGVGEDLDEKTSDGQAMDATKEEASKLGGDTMVIAEQKAEPIAGSGGTSTKITKTADVYRCAP